MELKIKAVSPKMGREIPLPRYQTAGAAAMDLCACVDEAVTLVAEKGKALKPRGFAARKGGARGKAAARWRGHGHLGGMGPEQLGAQKVRGLLDEQSR